MDPVNAGINDMKQNIGETRRLCRSLTRMLEKDAKAVHMAFHDNAPVEVGNSNRSTVGLMITGTKVHEILPGGPAHASQISRGSDS
jgi:hypothetical protein